MVCWAVLSHFPPFVEFSFVLMGLQVFVVAYMFAFGSLRMMDPKAAQLMNTLISYSHLWVFDGIVGFFDRQELVVASVTRNSDYTEVAFPI